MVVYGNRIAYIERFVNVANCALLPQSCHRGRNITFLMYVRNMQVKLCSLDRIIVLFRLL